jgi:hypothetical protein
MAEGSNKAQIISLGADSGQVIVQRGGIKVEFNCSGCVDVYSNMPVIVHPAANDVAKSKATPRIGDLAARGETGCFQAATEII